MKLFRLIAVLVLASCSSDGMPFVTTLFKPLGLKQRRQSHVHSQSTQKMLKFVKAPLDELWRPYKLWPDLSCVPAAWPPYYKDFLETDESDALLESIGLKGLYEVEKMAKSCSLDHVYQKFNSSNGDQIRDSCVQNCVLGKLNVTSGSWDVDIKVGDAEKAIESLKELLTGTSSHGLMNADLAAESMARYMIHAIRHFTETVYTKGFNCLDTTHFAKMIKPITRLLESGCAYTSSQWFPLEIDSVMKSATLQEVIADNSMVLWPDMSCFEGWVDVKKLGDSPQARTLGKGSIFLYEINRNCHEQYTSHKAFKKQFGTEDTSNCVKVCILEKLGALQPVKKEGEKESLFERRYELNKNSYMRPKSWRWISNILRDENGIESDAGRRLGEDFYRMVKSSLNCNGLARGFKCTKTKKLKHLFDDVDKFTKSKSHCGSVIREGYAKARKAAKAKLTLNGTRYWPDFKNLSAWHNNHSSAENVTMDNVVGLTKMSLTTDKCFKSSYVYDIKEKAIRCVKKCILSELKLINDDPNLRIVKPAKIENFISAIVKILPKKHVAAARKIIYSYPSFRDSEMWTKLTGKPCHSVFWDQVFKEFTSYVKELSIAPERTEDPVDLAKSLISTNGTRFWPDLECVPGWSNNIPKVRPTYENARGPVKMSMVNEKCFANYTGVMHLTEEEIARCVKQCVLREIGLMYVDPAGRLQLTPEPIATQILSQPLNFVMILDDRLRQSYQKKLVDSNAWDVASEKRCNEMEWDAVYLKLDEYFSQDGMVDKNCLQERADKEAAGKFSANKGFERIDDDYFPPPTTTTESPADDDSNESQESLEAITTVKDIRKKLTATSIWPDFTCMVGWYDAKNRDPSHPLAKSRQQGVELLKKTISKCIFNLEQTEITNCVKQCILVSLTILEENSTSEGTPLSLADEEEFQDGLAMILTDKGGFKSVRSFSENVYAVFNSSEIWNKVEGKDCQDDPEWDDFFIEFENHIEKQSRPPCVKARKEGEDERAKYLGNNHTQFTANLDLSCYEDFVYKGIDSGEGDMVPFLDIYNECHDMLERRGMNTECHDICMMNRMGIINWIRKESSESETNSSTVSVPKPANMTSNLKRFFSGSGNEATLTRITNQISEVCGEKEFLRQAIQGGCSEMGMFEDCVERTLSCRYTGNFLDHQKNESHFEGSETGDMSINIDYDQYPEIACRQGYMNTMDYRKGSGLLLRYNVECEALLQEKYFQTQVECMLERMGVLVVNSTRLEKGERINTYAFNDEQEITNNLNKVLCGFGGFDSSYMISGAIVNNCTTILETINAKEISWGAEVLEPVFRCISIAMECHPADLFTDQIFAG